MSSVVLTATLPTSRKSGTPLPLSDIASVTFLRDTGAGLQEVSIVAGPITTPTVAFTDASPAVGSNGYSFYVTDTKGLVGDAAPQVVVSNNPADPPAAGSLTATLNP